MIFTHQDISFEKKSSLKEFGQFIKAHPDIIIGAFGAKQKAYSEDYLCDTVDECCFGMTREVFDSLRFNEKICNGWHLYAVEMCLRAKERTKLGGMQSRHSAFFRRKCRFKLYEKIQAASCYV